MGKNDVDLYIENLDVNQQEWIKFFVNYMRENHPDIEEVISYKIPTCKLGTGSMRNYIAFSASKNHFSMHSMDFEYILLLKDKLKNPGKGKGCVNIKYSNIDERNVIIDAIEDIITRNSLRTSK